MINSTYYEHTLSRPYTGRLGRRNIQWKLKSMGLIWVLLLQKDTEIYEFRILRKLLRTAL